MIVNELKEVAELGVKIRKEPFADVYEVHSEIGRGKFAVVKRCVHRSSGLNYAAKFLHKRRRGRDCRHEALHEIQMLELTQLHPRIVDLVEVFETSHDIILVTEYVSGGELFQHIDVEGQLDEKTAVRLMRQILDGLTFLHSRNILHMDIKPQNILLTDRVVDGDVKLCDLGLARPFHGGDDVIEIVGTLDYVAPEVLDYVSVDSACDMWSIGVLAYVMLTGCSPFAGDSRQETLLNISQVNLDFPDELFSSVSKDAVDFIRRLLVRNTCERMTADECLQHSWLAASDVAPQSVTSPLLSRCRVPLLVDSPSGQRRALVATFSDDDVLGSHEPAKKCRCDVNDSMKKSTADNADNVTVRVLRDDTDNDSNDDDDDEDDGDKENLVSEEVLRSPSRPSCSEPLTVCSDTSFIIGVCLDVSVA